ncbi:MAG: D-alanyl-D-alanine carboxypeptidase family protein [Erythrobacter sp.]|nr:D-alanyl-D-alanine carboxypeptidase family protein [Erythrobacter sp.]
MKAAMLSRMHTRRIGIFAMLAMLALTAAMPARAQNAVEPAVPTPFDAPIAYLVDLTNGQILHAREADRRFVPASITKAMTLFHAFELMEEGALKPGQITTMRADTWREWSRKGSTMFIGANDRVLVDDLLMGIANVSANDGSVMLAEAHAGSVAQWTAGMNARAAALGMTDSHFGTPNGWPDDGGTFTSARDLVKLAEALVSRHPHKFARYIGRSGFRFNGIEQDNHDPLIGRTLGADGIKTGYTNEAGFGYLGTAARDGQRLALVIAGAPRANLRNRAARAYMEWGFAAFEQVRLFEAGEMVARVAVQGGEVRELEVQANRPVHINIPRGSAASPHIAVRYDGPLKAPIGSGEIVAYLEVTGEGISTARVPLHAARQVRQANVFERIVNAVIGWFA